MYRVRESWTDERLDDFRDEVNRRFDDVSQRFDRVESELRRVNDRLDGLHRTMIHGFIAMTGAIVASNVALVGLFVTQL
jgi:hypothetical protein